MPSKRWRCRWKGHKFIPKYSPGCGGKVQYDSALSRLVRTKRGRLVARKMPGHSCRLHYLENHFGLLALQCPRCTMELLQEETDTGLYREDLYTWVSLDLLFTVPKFGWDSRTSGAFNIRCWHCGFVFFPKAKWNPTRSYVERAVQLREWVHSLYPEAWDDGSGLGETLDGMHTEDVK